MGNKSLFFISLFVLATCINAEDFLQCVSINSKGNIEDYVHKPDSPKYSSILQNQKENPRWSNLTSAFPLFIVAPYQELQLSDVILCTKKLGLQLRIKSGGHDYEGLSTRCETPFIMIDLSNLTTIDIDLQNETAWIQTGVKLGQLYYTIANKSNTLAFPGGLCPTVGSGGLISGGGFGTLLRKYGLAADNVVDARIINANGQILDRAQMGEDLFWAIRGGSGANFGVVLAWKLKLVRVPEQVTAFTIRRKLDDEIINLVQKWQAMAYQFPDDLFMRIVVHNSPPAIKGGETIVQVSFQGLYLGTADKLVPLLSHDFPEFELETKNCFQGPVENKNCTSKPCIKKECFQVPWIKSVIYFDAGTTEKPLELLINPIFGKPRYYKAKSDFLTAPIPFEGWKMVRAKFLEIDSPFMIVDAFGGKMNQISKFELPFPHRNGTLYNIQYLVSWTDNNQTETSRHIEWIRSLYTTMEPFVSQSPRAAYVNYRDLDLGVNGESYGYEDAKTWGEKYFKDNFAKLARVKKQVDPTNFFRHEQSIPLSS